MKDFNMVKQFSFIKLLVLGEMIFFGKFTFLFFSLLKHQYFM